MVLCNLVFGELIQAKRDMGSDKRQIEDQSRVFDYDSTDYFDSYIAKTYYKTASMISLGCRGVAVLMNFDDTAAHRSLFDFGAHLGVAF